MSSRPDPFFAAVCALGVTQITAWGTSYYCLGVLAGPIARDTGWSRSLVYFGFTVSLLVVGAVSAWAGRAIDRYGARAVMSSGTVLVSAGLLLPSRGASGPGDSTPPAAARTGAARRAARAARRPCPSAPPP